MKFLSRGQILRLNAFFIALFAATVPATAADYPVKSVRVVVPFPPGGGADTISRVLFTKLSEDFGHQFIIDNRGGASGTIGAALVAKASNDGYVILHDATGHSINPAMFPALPYHSVRDFDPVFLAGTVPNLLVMHPSIKANTVPELIALAKATKEGLNWASSGTGSVQHMALELFKVSAGIALNHIPYKGGAPALIDVAGGHTKFYFSNAAASTGHVKAGTIRSIAHTGRGRLAALPDIPPMADTLPGYEAYEWNGVFAPANTPRAIIDKLNAEFAKAVDAPKTREIFAANAAEAMKLSPEAMQQQLEQDMKTWAEVVKVTGVKQ